MDKVTKWINYNRFIVIGPIVAVLIWFYAASCTPLTPSPIDKSVMLTEPALKLEFEVWKAGNEIMIKRFEAAGQDIEAQKAGSENLETMVLQIASGGVADLPGLLKLFLTGGGLGAIADNIRKRGLIAGLKNGNKKKKT